MVRMMRLPVVEAVTGLSGTTIWRRERDGEFPRRRRLGAGVVAWRSDEIEAWIEALPAADEGTAPASKSGVSRRRYAPPVQTAPNTAPKGAE